MDLLRRLGFLLLPLALLAAGARPARAAAGPRLLTPRAGTELHAGALAVISWENAPPEAEEWEAFLSLDGGRTYPLRVTPHLDLGIRRFAFRVPPFPTREARVLLRFGDERREVEFETPQRFAISSGDTSLPPDLRIALSRGERPRPRDSGVVIWMEGSRDGSGLHEVAAAEEDCSLRAVEPARPLWMPLVWPSRQRTGQAAPPLLAHTLYASLAAPPDDDRPAPPVRPSVRLLTGRRNE